MLLQLKFVFMTFKIRNDCICGTPTSTQPIIILPSLQNGIDSVLKNLTDMLPTWHLHTTSHNRTRTYVLPTMTSSTTIIVFQSVLKGITAQIHSVLVAIHIHMTSSTKGLPRGPCPLLKNRNRLSDFQGWILYQSKTLTVIYWSTTNSYLDR